jgi:hypothetical protein
MKGNNTASCDLFCFKQCSDKYEAHIEKKDLEAANKLSLKRITSSHKDYREDSNRIKKSTSQNQF